MKGVRGRWWGTNGDVYETPNAAFALVARKDAVDGCCVRQVLVEVVDLLRLTVESKGRGTCQPRRIFWRMLVERKRTRDARRTHPSSARAISSILEIDCLFELCPLSMTTGR